MNRIILIILFNSLFYLVPLCAQNNINKATLKPSPDACPTWTGKQTISKADYFLFLRTSSKSQKANEYSMNNATNKKFDKPIYYSLVPQKTISEYIEPKHDQKEIGTVTEIIDIPQIQIETSPVSQNNNPIQNSAELDSNQIHTVIPANQSEEITSNDLSKQEKNPSLENIKVRKKFHLPNLRKTERKHWLRKINFRKKGTGKCPDF